MSNTGKELNEKCINFIVQGISKLDEQVIVRCPLIAEIETVTGSMPNLNKLSTQELLTLHKALVCS